MSSLESRHPSPPSAGRDGGGTAMGPWAATCCRASSINRCQSSSVASRARAMRSGVSAMFARARRAHRSGSGDGGGRRDRFQEPGRLGDLVVGVAEALP